MSHPDPILCELQALLEWANTHDANAIRAELERRISIRAVSTCVDVADPGKDLLAFSRQVGRLLTEDQDGQGIGIQRAGNRIVMGASVPGILKQAYFVLPKGSRSTRIRNTMVAVTTVVTDLIGRALDGEAEVKS